MVRRGARLGHSTGGLLLLAVATAAVPPGSAQAPGTRPRFATISIQPCAGETAVAGKEGPLSRITLECYTVDRLIRLAYLSFPNGQPLPVSPTTGLPMPSLSMRQHDAPIEGSPPWTGSDRFTIEAESGQPATREMMLGPMLQVLLEDRFHLKIDRQTREIPVYQLTAAQGGRRLQTATQGSCILLDLSLPAPPAVPGRPAPVLCGALRPSGRNGGLEVYGVTMADLCSQLSVWLDHDVVDKTGLSGVFDIHLDLSAGELTGGGSGTSAEASGPLAQALRKLGLRLEPGKGPGEFLVIDHVEKPGN